MANLWSGGVYIAYKQVNTLAALCSLQLYTDFTSSFCDELTIQNMTLWILMQNEVLKKKEFKDIFILNYFHFLYQNYIVIESVLKIFNVYTSTNS